MNETCYFITTKFVIHNYKKTKKKKILCVRVCENGLFMRICMYVKIVSQIKIFIH